MGMLRQQRGLPVSSNLAICSIDAHHVAFGLNWKILGTHNVPTVRRQDYARKCKGIRKIKWPLSEVPNMRHSDSCVHCLSAIDYADSLCAWLVDSLFYWAQSLCRCSLGPVLPTCLRTRSQRCESHGAPKVGGRRVSNTPQRASPQRRSVPVALVRLRILHISERSFVSGCGGQACVFRVSVAAVGLVRSSVCCGVRNSAYWRAYNCPREHFYLRSLLISSDHDFPSRISPKPYYTTWN